MKIMKIRKPNAALHAAIKSNKLKVHDVKVSQSRLKIVYRNEEDLRTLRLLIETDIPSHLMDADLFRQFRLRDFETIAISKYMGYTTMKCRKIIFEDADGDQFELEVI